MMDRTWQLAFTHGFRDDPLIELCAAIATVGGASFLDGGAPRLRSVTDRRGLNIGDPTLLVVEEDSIVAVMDRPSNRTVIHRGRIVRHDLTLV